MSSEPKWTSKVGADEWDRFIEENRATPFQLWSWRMLLKECGNDPEYLVYKKPNGTILAACPLFRVKVGKFRYKLAGPNVAERVAAPEEKIPPKASLGILPVPSLFGGSVNILDAARSLQQRIKRIQFPIIGSVELSTSQPRVIESLKGLGFHNWKGSGEFVTDLDMLPPDKIWADSFGKHDRQAVKYFDSEGAAFRVSSDEEEFTRFFKLYQGSSLREGYTPMTREYFALIRKHLGGRVLLALSDTSGELVGGQLLVLDKASQTLHVAYVGYSRLRNIHSPVVFLWFRICVWARENGFRYISFGGAGSEAAYDLKRKFGGEFTQDYNFVLPNPSNLYLLSAAALRKARPFRKVVARESSLNVLLDRTVAASNGGKS